jgi:peptide/nickel transport system permease protein
MIKKPSKRAQTICIAALIFVFLLCVYIGGILLPPTAYDADFGAKNLAPSFAHLFGTDWLGRDMFSRTVKGLTTSIIVGVLASAVSAFIALVLGTLAATMGKKCDLVVTWIVDLFQSVPHIVLIMLVSIAVGKGLFGVLVGVALTHWTTLTRVIRAEILALKDQPYIGVSRALGKSALWIGKKHTLPHIFPQFVTGLILLFPHAILHEAAITFLGFGLPPEQPAIGVILSESMKYLSGGMWHLVVFPGLSLLLIVLVFDALGEYMRTLFDPNTAQL